MLARPLGERWSPDSSGAVLLAILVPLLIVFALSAQWTFPYQSDALTNAISGWSLGTRGTVIVPEAKVLTTPEHHGYMSWFVESPRGTVSQYPPGAAVVAAATYALSGVDADPVELIGDRYPSVQPVRVPLPPMWPATLSAVLVTAIACAVLGVVVHDLGATGMQAVAAGLVAGLATAAWSVASNMSWSHGPGMLAIACALLAASRDRWWLAGLAFGAGILARPHLAIGAAVLGLVVLVERRDLRAVLALGLGSATGLCALLAYNHWLWDEWTVVGGYTLAGGSGLAWTAQNIALGFVHPGRGLLWLAPFLLVLVPAAWRSRRAMPPWVSGAALGGLAVLVLQWSVNRYSGGYGYFGYRYPLEGLTLAMPALWVAWRDVVAPSGRLRRWVAVLLILAAVAQLVGAVGT